MGRRKRLNDKRASDFLVGTFTEKVGRMMENRHRLLAPFPIDATLLYQHYWTPQEWQAVQVLRGREDLFESTWRVMLTSEIMWEDKKKRITIEVKLGAPAPAVGAAIPVDALPEAMAKQIHEWVPLWMGLAKDKARLLEKVNAVADVCNTYGQLARLWPELEGFFGSAGKAQMAGKAVRSPLPQKALEWTNGEPELMERFRPEAFVPFAEMIAECLMLPEVPGDHVGKVTAYPGY